MTEESRLERLLEQLNAKVCNCGGCNALLLGRGQNELKRIAVNRAITLPPEPRIRLKRGLRQIPYCPDCVASMVLED